MCEVHLTIIKKHRSTRMFPKLFHVIELPSTCEYSVNSSVDQLYGGVFTVFPTKSSFSHLRETLLFQDENTTVLKNYHVPSHPLISLHISIEYHLIKHFLSLINTICKRCVQLQLKIPANYIASQLFSLFLTKIHRKMFLNIQ